MIKKTDIIFKNLYGKKSPYLSGALKRDDWQNTSKYLNMSPQDIIEIVKQSGLRGGGGAGFSTGM